MVYILFIIGFILLITGAEWLVTGSASVAKKFNISEMVIGLTIVSIGTSAPELIVNVIASLNGNSEIAIGNIFGSNIANVLLILGLTALIYPVPIRKNTIRTDIPFVLIATLLVGFLANSHLSNLNNDSVQGELSVNFLEGALLLLFFLIFISYALKINKKNTDEPEQNIKEKPMKISVALIAIGITCLFFGGKWVVDGAVAISGILGLSEGFVGLTIVAVGTSLPELVTSIVAARRKNVDIAVGNVIGSNIFNLLWVIGLSAMINPLNFKVINNLDILVMIFSTLLILVVVTFNKKFYIARWSGALFVSLYIIYIAYLLYRG
ncbi:MAG: calcium/sodium antiporter [Bacteroidales bacterium]|nr:calcium/sodium antiporter [Bacteroidales bacterium]